MAHLLAHWGPGVCRLGPWLWLHAQWCMHVTCADVGPDDRRVLDDDVAGVAVRLPGYLAKRHEVRGTALMADRRKGVGVVVGGLLARLLVGRYVRPLSLGRYGTSLVLTD